MDSKKDKRNRQLFIAISTTITAALLGFVMVSISKPLMVLCVIGMACCATFQWFLYFAVMRQTQIDEIAANDKSTETKL